jgi:AcrR family transcriptional regulator
MGVKKKMPDHRQDTPLPRVKDELFWRVFDSVIRLECTRGHLKWKMTDLSRMSGVTRTLIYYYFGKSKIELVQSAIKVIGGEFFGLDPSVHSSWERGDFLRSIELTRQLFRKAPYTGVFYLTQRQPGAVFQAEILDLERRYLQRLARFYPRASEEKLHLLFAALLGMVWLPDLKMGAISRFLRRGA